MPKRTHEAAFDQDDLSRVLSKLQCEPVVLSNDLA